MPSHATVPRFASSTPRTMRIVVVLPAPFAPRKPKTWPRGTSNVSPSSATTDPNVLWSWSMTRLTRPRIVSRCRERAGTMVRGGRISSNRRRVSIEYSMEAHPSIRPALAAPRPACDHQIVTTQPLAPSPTVATRIHADREARTLRIDWQDEHVTIHDFTALRWLCPCAYCRGEAGMPGWLDSAPTLTAEQTRPVDILLVGHYAGAPSWGDGHHTGYYT